MRRGRRRRQQRQPVGKLEAEIRGRRKKVKMKPPWGRDSSRHEIGMKAGKLKILLTLIKLIMLIVLFLACDTIQVCRASPGTSQGGELARGQSHHRLASDQSPPAGLPYFNSSSPSSLVIASSYQNEIYLPCRILNLDEDQTVSFLWVFVFVFALCASCVSGARSCSPARLDAGRPVASLFAQLIFVRVLVGQVRACTRAPSTDPDVRMPIKGRDSCPAILGRNFGFLTF